MASASEPFAELRRRVYETLELGPYGSGFSRAVTRALVLLIVVNLVSVTLESVPELAARYRALFFAVEAISLVVFTVEYGLRLWIAAEHAPAGTGVLRARLRYAASPAGIVDLLAILPFWIALIWPFDLRMLLVFRIVRFLKLARYSSGMDSLLNVIARERRALFACFVILIGATLIVASLMHLIERGAQPDKFGTIPDAMWWAIVTLATVGYGDVVPVTPLGRLLTSFIIFGGVIIVALPIGIIATAFAQEIHRRDFVVTWSMVARVPLFAGLNAAEIADVARLLRARTVEAGTTIVRRGELGNSMYFVAAGEVEIELDQGRVRLGVGDFFGEIAVVRRTQRIATVKALTRTSLFELEADDLHALMERAPDIAARVQAVAKERLASAGGNEPAVAQIVPQQAARSKPARKRSP